MQVRVRGSSESPDPRGLIGFAAAWDCCFSFLHINQYRSPARPRKRDQPQVICPEGSAAILRWWLLPIHRFFDNAALQQSSGMDHLLQAGVSVPLSGVWSLNTHTHTQTPRQLYFPCTVRAHFHAVSGSLAVPWCQHTSRFFPSFTSPLLFLLLSSPTPLLIKPKVPTYSRLLGRKRKPITCTEMTLWDDSCACMVMFVSDGSSRV